MEFQYYYYGSQADQFSFIRIPKMMLTEDTFSTLSIPAKVLYGVLLDRMNLSRQNIGYDDLLVAYPYDGDLIEGIADLILETVIGKSNYILIASSNYPAELVKSKLLKLDYEHVEYVIACMKKTTTKIWNIKKYLLASLFNAPSTIGGYYQTEANHDMG